MCPCSITSVIIIPVQVLVLYRHVTVMLKKTMAKQATDCDTKLERRCSEVFRDTDDVNL